MGKKKDLNKKAPKRIRKEADLSSEMDDTYSENILESTTVVQASKDQLNDLLKVEDPSNKQILEGIGVLLQLQVNTCDKIEAMRKSINSHGDKPRNHATHIVEIKQNAGFLNAEINKNRAEINYLQQLRFDNDIIVSGFPSKPDAVLAVQNICTHYNYDSRHIASAYSYDIATKKTKNKSNTATTSDQTEENSTKMGFLVLSFKSKNGQVIFNKARKSGASMFANQVIEELDDEIGCVKLSFRFKLTAVNRIINRELNHLLEAGTISSVKYRNCSLFFKEKEEDPEMRVATLETLSAIKAKSL